MYMIVHVHVHVYTCGVSVLCIYFKEPAVKLDVVVEPSFVALGPFHMAVGINDRAWIYEIRDHGMSGLYTPPPTHTHTCTPNTYMYTHMFRD